MNPVFTVTVDLAKRKVSTAGIVAVGEKVDVSIVGLDPALIPDWEQDNTEGFTGPSLRFRLVAPDGKDLVRFPLAEGDAWTVNADDSFSAEVDFNTMPLRHWFHGFAIDAKGEVGLIVDSVVDAMEYGRGTVKVLQWAASPAEDPTILPDWRETLRDLNAAIVEISGSVETAQNAAASAGAARDTALEYKVSAETAATNALGSESRAQGYKSDAETAATNALGYKSDAQSAAATATTKAGEAAGSANDAAQILEEIEEAIAGKAEQSDLEAEVSRAKQAESGLTDGLDSANRAIADNADAIDQLEEDKADKSAIDSFSDRIDEEAALRASVDDTKADKSTTYTKTEVDAKIAGVQTFQKYLVNELPDLATADMKGIYLVPTGESTPAGDLCEEWTVVEESGVRRWERIGGTTVDLSEYANMVSVTWAQLVELRNHRELVPGQQYRITDYVATTVQTDTQSANHPFDIIVTADDERTLNEHARAIQHVDTAPDFSPSVQYAVGDLCKYNGFIYQCTVAHLGEWVSRHFRGVIPYFRNCNLAAWDVWYCFDNDVERFEWADATNGKGVVYRLVDEFQNDLPYDFKGIQFKAFGDDSNVWRYTFDNNGLGDNSLDGFGNRVYNNTVVPVIGSAKILNRIVFIGIGCEENTFGSDCVSITFGSHCARNTFGKGCGSIVFGSHCESNTIAGGFLISFGSQCNLNTVWGGHDITLGEQCNNNTFGVDCGIITLGQDCSCNTFAQECNTNEFGAHCINNTIKARCYHNTFGDYCGSNTLESYCEYITLGGYCGHCEFGTSCNHIKFGDASSVKFFCRSIRIASGNQFLYIYPTGTTSANNYYQNVEVLSGVNNTATYKVISDANTGQTYNTVYKPANSKEISV